MTWYGNVDIDIKASLLVTCNYSLMATTWSKSVYYHIITKIVAENS